MNIINKYIEKFTNKAISKIEDKITSMDVTKEQANVNLVTNISSFRNKLNARTGVARPNQFAISFELPSWMNGAKSLSYFGVTQFNEELGILCNKFTPPAKSMNTTSVRYGNNIERKIPTGYKWDSAKFSFIETGDYLCYNMFNEWLDGIMNPLTNTGKFYDEITADVKINFLNKNNDIIAYYTLLEAYPSQVTLGEYNWEVNNTFVTVDVEFDYVYPTNRDYNLSMLFNAISEFGSSDVANTVHDAIGELKNMGLSTIKSKLKSLVHF